MKDIKGNLVAFRDSGAPGDQAYVQLTYKYLDFDDELIGKVFFSLKETEYLRAVRMRFAGEVVYTLLNCDKMLDQPSVSLYDLVDFKQGVLDEAEQTERFWNELTD